MKYTDVSFNYDKGYWDLSIGSEGDFDKENSFNTAILLSIIGSKRRASATEVPEPSRREGWIGSINRPVELGSKLWLLYQSRLIQRTLNAARTYLEQALSWLVEFGYLKRVIVVDVRRDFDRSAVVADIRLERFNGQIETRTYTLWENSGGVTNTG